MKKITMDSFTMNLSRSEMKNINGGFVDPPPDTCLGCRTDQQCKDINKGDKCNKDCPGKDYKGCSGY